MPLNINPSSSEERKKLFVEILLNKTSNVSKVSNESVLNGIAYGIGKVSGKAEKDIILALGKLYPSTSYGSNLDIVAAENGISDRFTESESSTFIRLVGASGTTYISGTHIFESDTGIQFSLEKSVVIGNIGFTYAKVRSIEKGLSTNVKPATINKVTPIPTGHQYCINEYQAMYGRDNESDDMYRIRIREGANILSKTTMSMLEQVFMSINNNILALRYQGINSKGQKKIAVITQNGIDLNQSEFDEILQRGELFFSLSELRPYGKKSYGIELVNIDYDPIDVSFRCSVDNSADIDQVAIDIQTRFSKYIDPRFFNPTKSRVEWDNLLEIVKNTKGISYVPDQYFYPRNDLTINKNKIPRFRGFLMLDLNGNILKSNTSNLNPSFYPNNLDFSYISTVLRNI